MAERLCRTIDRSMRRECLDHVIVFGEQHLRRRCARTSSTITAPEHICHWARTHRCREPFMPPRAFFRCRSSADCITIMSESDLRHGQPCFKIMRIRLAALENPRRPGRSGAQGSACQASQKSIAWPEIRMHPTSLFSPAPGTHKLARFYVLAWVMLLGAGSAALAQDAYGGITGPNYTNPYPQGGTYFSDAAPPLNTDVRPSRGRRARRAAGY
jgi:hypothetical protein